MDRIVLHRKTSIRKYRQRLSTLFVVVGSLCILIGAAIALSALTRLEYEQPRFFRLGSYFAFGGLVFVILHLLFFTLPDYMEKRRSGVVIRRKALSKSYHRPKPGQVATHTGEGGSILILVLVLLGILSALSLQVIVSARSAAAESSATMNMELLKLAAIDATRTAMQELANDIDLTTDHLNESWAINQEYEDPSGISRLIRVIDAERSFDLNNISVPITGSLLPPSEVLANILILCGDFRPGEKLDNLRDWVDTDTTGPRESPYYQKKAAPYNVADHILFGWEELFHVEGWNESMFERDPYRQPGTTFKADLAETVTIVPEQRSRIVPININTAGAATLQGILGIGHAAVVDRILTGRKTEPFRETDFLADLVSDEEFKNMSPYLDVKSHYFHIQATAYRDGKSAQVYVLARRSDEGRVDAIQSTF